MNPHERNAELELTRLAREGRTDKQNPAGAEHLMRMSWEDLMAFAGLYPDILSKDPIAQSKALDELFASPLAEKFRVARTPTQVKRAPRSPIIVRNS